jgi:hypothetical protein
MRKARLKLLTQTEETILGAVMSTIDESYVGYGTEETARAYMRKNEKEIDETIDEVNSHLFSNDPSTYYAVIHYTIKQLALEFIREPLEIPF